MGKNLIHNAKFNKCSKDTKEEIHGFCGHGWYRNTQKVSGYYTCTVLDQFPYPAIQTYVDKIDTQEKRVLLYGYTIRALQVIEVCFVVTFFHHETIIGEKRKEITQQIKWYYRPIMEKFVLPKDCTAVQVSLHMEQPTKGCSFFAPTVYVF